MTEQSISTSQMFQECLWTSPSLHMKGAPLEALLKEDELPFFPNEAIVVGSLKTTKFT